jgi:DNA-binding winged helix-turn-helix (wHTH) protein/Flp pilus assembly protein TadD
VKPHSPRAGESQADRGSANRDPAVRNDLASGDGGSKSDEPILEFGGFRFHPDRGLSRDGRVIHLARKEQRGLAALLARRGAALSRHEYAQAAWRGGDASDESIARSIYLLRRALGCNDRTEVLETIHGFGYRISVEVGEVRADTPSTAAKTVQGVRPAAFETFQLGRELLARRTPSDLEAAIRAFLRAAELDPRYAAPWVAIADCRINQAMRWYLTPKTAGQLALAAAERALSLDPGAAGAFAARGWVHGAIEGRVDSGLDDLERAIALDPSYWLTRFYHSWLLPALGRHDEALMEARAACDLNPLHPVPRSMIGWLLFCSDRPHEARDFLRAAADELGGSRQILRVLAAVEAWLGDPGQALSIARRVEEAEGFAPDGTTVLAYALARAGDTEGALRIVRRWEDPSRAHPAPTHMAAVYLELGDRDRAAAALAFAEESGCPQRVIARNDPRLAALRRAWPRTHGCERGDGRAIASVRARPPSEANAGPAA